MNKQMTFFELLRKFFNEGEKEIKFNLEYDLHTVYVFNKDGVLDCSGDHRHVGLDEKCILIEEPEKVVVCWFMAYSDGKIEMYEKYEGLIENKTKSGDWKLIKEETIEVEK